MTFFPMHILGLDGMPRRIADYPASTGWTGLNVLISVGSAIIAISLLVFGWNFVANILMGRGREAGPDPWHGFHLEWATTSPPPHHNFTHIPPIRSERPVFDARVSAEEAVFQSTPDMPPPEPPHG